VDAFTLDGLLREVAPLLSGRPIVRVRAAEAHAVLLEPPGARDVRLWLDAGRLAPGLYALTRDQARAAQDDRALAGASRQAVLRLRKHLEGRRVVSLRRVLGDRIVVLEATGATLVLHLSARPSLTLAVEDRALATLGEGEPCWPAPADAPEREWEKADHAALARLAQDARDAGRSPVRAVLERCPVLGPALARRVAEAAEPSEVLRGRLARPQPVLLAPRALEQCDEADLAPADALALWPCTVPGTDRVALPQPSWIAGAAALLLGRLRGARFERGRRARVESAAREARRAAQLLAHLQDDLRGLPAAEGLRRQAEALLAAPEAKAQDGVIEVPDPYAPEEILRVRIDAAAGPHASADRLFAKARRIERARLQVRARIEEVRGQLSLARAGEAAARAARRASDLDALAPATPRPASAPAARGTGGVRHYLSSRGLSILVGRGGRENHHLTFAVAGPEDLWMHARDTPGAHVIVRDPEGRAAADDLREAAELAAFFSDAAGQAQVDVHVTRRKHVRPARGGGGRVIVGHSETLRVTPRDPGAGRLRRR
jgi:hypothetical protein